MKPLDVSVIVPTYNEKGNICTLIGSVIRELEALGRSFEIVVVDDSSPDGTAQAVNLRYGADQRILCIERHGSPNLGKSILLGITKSHGEIIVGMDGDGNHDPAYLRFLLGALSAADIAVGSRFVSGGGMKHPWRYMTSRAFNSVLRAWYRFPISDNTSGYYALRRTTFHRLPVRTIYDGYGEYHLRLVYTAVKRHLKIIEVPVVYPDRQYGQSKSRVFTMMVTYLQAARDLQRMHA